MRGSETRPRADRGASDPHRSSEPPQGATVFEFDDDASTSRVKATGHGPRATGVTCSGSRPRRHAEGPPMTLSDERGTEHRGSRDAGGRQGLAARRRQLCLQLDLLRF